MPTQLFNHINLFLSRGSVVNTLVPTSPSPSHLYTATGWSSMPLIPPAKPVSLHVSNKEFLPHCTLGKGERAIHFLLYNFLATHVRGYGIIPEYSPPGVSEAFDLLVIDDQSGKPIAAVELKHYSIHQTDGVTRLLKNSVTNPLNPPSPCIDTDRAKLSHLINFKFHDGIIYTIPLIQIGLFTAIYEPQTSSTVVRFLDKYVDHKRKLGALVNKNSIDSNRFFLSAITDVQNWWGGLSPNPYQDGVYGWGPLESFPILGTPPTVQVVGRVGFVCVITP